MSWQTAECRKQIDAAKKGDKYAERVLRHLLAGIAKNEETPINVIIELAEVALYWGIEQGRKDAEMN